MSQLEVGVGNTGGTTVIKCKDTDCNKVHDFGDYFVYVKVDDVLFLLAKTIRCGAVEFDTARPFEGIEEAKQAAQEAWQSVIEQHSLAHLHLVRVSEGSHLQIH